MTKEEEIRMINEKLDFYVMEASDEEFKMCIRDRP